MSVQDEGCKVVWAAGRTIPGKAKYAVEYTLRHANANNRSNRGADMQYGQRRYT
jgi:hypothetical protein